MSLSRYQQKRNFNETKEPKAQKKAAGKKLRFVVQRHHASHLHYDFRLELDGVLKSWAVPKGPSLNPKDKRLAMMVEDHPFSYKDFEGEIPKGNYGAGTVYIFDEGEYESLAESRKDDEKTLSHGLKSGNLKFRLKGKILKGEFALVRLKGEDDNSWLLIKHKDDFAVKTAFNIEKMIPDTVIREGKAFKKKEKEIKVVGASSSETKGRDYSPMLATLADEVFDHEDWLFERKLDGYRILAYTGSKVNLITRNGKNYSKNYEQITKALKAIEEEAVIDGEIVALDPAGKDHFQTLQHFDNESDVILRFFVFDLLALNGHDLTDLPLIKRKELLKTLIEKYGLEEVVYNEHVEKEGKNFFKKAQKKKWEGIIGKLKSDTYSSGRRTSSWLKFKFSNSQEVLICGYTEPSGSRKHFGALVLGILNDENELAYAGNCGTGFTDADLKDMYEQMQPLETNEKPFTDKVNKERTVQWLKPELVGEVTFTEWTKDRHLRHPVFKGLRTDKEKESVKQEHKIHSVSTAKDKEMEDEKTVSVDGKKVKLTNLNKLYWPKEKITKGELIDYYDQMAEYIMPYLKDKPLSLNRHPNGITKPGFYQKDVDTKQIPSWAKTTVIHSESNNKDIDYLVSNNKATLLFMANLGCIEINPWLSSYRKPENPDFMVIDLDPDKNDFKEVVDVAFAVKEVLDALEIKSYVKTSGSTGIHIYVYVARKYDYDFIKDFAQFIAQQAHEKFPDITSLERSPSKRKGLIYIDFLQNRRGQTIAAPYSARPKPGATVSFPLDWNNLTSSVKIKDFDIFNVPEMVKKKGTPWESIFDTAQNLKEALRVFKKRGE